MITFGKYLKMKPQKLDEVWGTASVSYLINNEFIPITHSTYTQALKIKPKRYSSFFHSTSFSNINRIKEIEGTKNAISTSTIVDDYLVKGVETEADMLIEMSGILLYSHNQDAQTQVDSNGRRWVKVKNPEIISIINKYKKMGGGVVHKMDIENCINDIISSSGYKEFLLKHNGYKKPKVTETKSYNECIIDNIKITRIMLYENIYDYSDKTQRRKRQLKKLFNVPIILDDPSNYKYFVEKKNIDDDEKF